jgi:hypothetical protein
VVVTAEKPGEFSMEDCPSCHGRGKITLLTRVRLRDAK